MVFHGIVEYQIERVRTIFSDLLHKSSPCYRNFISLCPDGVVNVLIKFTAVVGPHPMLAEWPFFSILSIVFATIVKYCLVGGDGLFIAKKLKCGGKNGLVFRNVNGGVGQVHHDFVRDIVIVLVYRVCHGSHATMELVDTERDNSMLMWMSQ